MPNYNIDPKNTKFNSCNARFNVLISKAQKWHEFLSVTCLNFLNNDWQPCMCLCLSIGQSSQFIDK